MAVKDVNYYKQLYEGKVYQCCNSDAKFIIREYKSYQEVVIEFNIGMPHIVKTVAMKYIKNNKIYDPFGNSPIMFTDIKKQYIGRWYKSNSGMWMQIINVEDYKHATVRFENGYEFTTNIYNIQHGNVRNPYVVDKFGGYLGEDKTYRKDEYQWLNTLWRNILIKANPDNREYYLHYKSVVTSPYENCYVSEDWKCYSNFANWYMQHFKNLNPEVKYDVDKDLLFPLYKNRTNGMHCYGDQYCVLIPHEINILMESQYDHTTKKFVMNLYNKTNLYFNNGALERYVYDIIMDHYVKPYLK